MPATPGASTSTSRSTTSSSCPTTPSTRPSTRRLRRGSPFTQLIFAPLGAGVAHVDRQAMALNLPDAERCYFCLAMWMDRAETERETAWARSLMEIMRPWATNKAPPNFIHADEGAESLRASYGDDKFERLVALKNTFDPGNLFALNQNIPPSMPPAHA